MNCFPKVTFWLTPHRPCVRVPASHSLWALSTAQGRLWGSTSRPRPWVGCLGGAGSCMRLFLRVITFHFEISNLNNIPKELWERLTMQPPFKCSCPGWPQTEWSSALEPSRDGRVSTRERDSEQLFLQVATTYGPMFQIKPAALLPMPPALDMGEVMV